MMKKLLFPLLLASLSLTATAQDGNLEAVPTERHSVSTNPFFSNWFQQAGAGANVNYDNHVAFSVAIGKWFTPGIGLRTRFTFSHNNAITEHVLFNLTNMFMGYRANRVWNLIPYVGAGWRRHEAVNLDASYGSYQLSSKQRALNLELGLTYSIGKGTWKNTPDQEAINALSQSEIDALNAQLSDAYAENDELRQQLEQQQQQLEQQQQENQHQIPPATDNNMTLPVTPE